MSNENEGPLSEWVRSMTAIYTTGDLADGIETLERRIKALEAEKPTHVVIDGVRHRVVPPDVLAAIAKKDAQIAEVRDATLWDVLMRLNTQQPYDAPVQIVRRLLGDEKIAEFETGLAKKIGVTLREATSD